MARLGIIATVLLVAGSSFATTIHVPADQPTIQAGIDAASNEDTVLVAPGTYVENVDFGPKNAIFLLSEQGRDVTAIRSGSAGKPVINVPNHSDTTSIIRGFTVTDANDAPGIQASGGRIIEECRVANGSSDGIYCLGTFQIIRKCLVYGNFAGGCDGIIFYGDSCEILNNETYDNHQSGIYVASGRGLIAYNLIRDNYDWGIYCPSEFRIRNNTVLRNPNGGIFLETQEQQTHVLNNIVSGNGNGIVVEGTTTIDYNDLWQNGGGGNDAGQHGIYADPLFISPSMNNYRLSSGSPCIDAGDPDPQYNDPNGTRNDMGALPYPARSWHVSLDGDDVAGDGSQLNPFATIQRGVDTAGNGDTVLVADGTYTGDGNRDINILGKAVVVMSAGGPENTIMDCQATAEDQHVAFWLDLDGDMSTVISGFTIRNAWRVDYAAVYCSGGPVLLDNCILRDNHCNAVYQHGGTGSALVMRNCRITSNSGRGLDCAYSRVDITESVFDSNLVAGARVTWGGSGAFKKCTFVGNGGAGVDGSYTETLSIDSCIFDGNGGAGLCGSDGDEPHLFTVRDSRFENNQGAGFDVPTSQGLTHMVERCYFGNNHGSGVRREVEAALALTDCVFVQNSAQEGGGSEPDAGWQRHFSF